MQRKTVQKYLKVHKMKKTIKLSIECIKREQKVTMANLQIFTLRQPDNILKNMNTHTVCMYCSVSSTKKFWTKVNKRIFRIFKMYFVQHCFICRPLDFTVSEDAEIKPRFVSSLALAVRRST